MNAVPDLAPPVVVPAATGPAPWFAIGGLVLIVLVASALRIVDEHERAVVSRLGRVIRVGGPGLVLRIPAVESIAVVSTQPVQLPLVVSGQTRDGASVHLVASGTCRIVDPARSAVASRDPLLATAVALEAALAEAVARTDLAGLLPLRPLLASRLPGELTAQTAAWGVRVDALEVSNIETRLSAELLRIAASASSVPTSRWLPDG